MAWLSSCTGPSKQLYGCLTTPTWTDQLPWVLLGPRTAPKFNLLFSPADLTLRHTPLLPGEMIQQSLACPRLPTSTCHHPDVPVPSSNDLPIRHCCFMFIREDVWTVWTILSFWISMGLLPQSLLTSERHLCQGLPQGFSGLFSASSGYITCQCSLHLLCPFIHQLVTLYFMFIMILMV